MFSAIWYATGHPRLTVSLEIRAEGLCFERQIWPYASLHFEWGGAETRLIEIHNQRDILYCSDLILLEDLERHLSPEQYQQTQTIFFKARPSRRWKSWFADSWLFVDASLNGK